MAKSKPKTQRPMPPPAPASAILPRVLEEIDLLRLRALSERTMRQQSEFKRLAMEQAQTEQQMRALDSALRGKYQLGPRDDFSLDNGLIARRG